MKLPLIVANWKMNMVPSRATVIVEEFKRRFDTVHDREIAVAPPFTSLERTAEILQGTSLKIAAQNVHWAPQGPFTGEISALMLKELRCSYVLLGHSERRRHFGETDEMISAKVKAVLSSRMKPILCIGETGPERDDGLAFQVVGRQLLAALKGSDKSAIGEVVIAYEPVWAIGTGKTALPIQAQQVHEHIRRLIQQNWDERSAKSARILYGGSVKPENARDLMDQDDVDGLLVGDASLSPGSFESIIQFKGKREC